MARKAKVTSRGASAFTAFMAIVTAVGGIMLGLQVAITLTLVAKGQDTEPSKLHDSILRTTLMSVVFGCVLTMLVIFILRDIILVDDEKKDEPSDKKAATSDEPPEPTD